MPDLAPLHFMGSSQKDLRKMPKGVKLTVGSALTAAQLGGKSPAAKPLRGFGGAGVLEVVEDENKSTYRAVYTVRFAGTVYVPCMRFRRSQKPGSKPIRPTSTSSKTGSPSLRSITMPTTKLRTQIEVRRSSGNVFADLGLSNAGELLEKAQLVHQICAVISREKLGQSQAARRLGIDQPKVSALMRGKLTGFSTDRLLKFLILLHQDVTITVKPAPKRRVARVLVEAV